ncbi:hypothetical protein B5M09_011503 [Aphanomyces astaci]|uniref:SET domain-containing protein n=1 Tax=Aphanomyces astaci TaxID=112090 RepID=A0A425DJZ5_APHAT|nr:hypothetical protein B5M09_011503 [Aphanomyces astaci]
MEYIGEVIKKAEFESRYASMVEAGEVDFYFLSLRDECFIDARNYSNNSRFINHSCEPNCAIEVWKDSGVKRAVIVALDDIGRLEELTFDYNCPTNSGKKVKEIAVQLTKKLNFEKIELEMEAIDCEGKTYSYLVENEVVYICVADASVGRGAVTAFLKHIQAQFEEQFGVRGKMTKLKLDMQRDFGAILKTHMEMLSSQGGMQKLEALRKDLDGVKDSMQHNIGKVLERGDKIDLLVDKSESLKFVPT